MHRYFIKTPWIVKQLFKSYVWEIPSRDKAVYLTFDDGPHPIITSWVLDQLKKFNASATFFCIGKNVLEYPEIYQQILIQNHSVGNHTFNHLNGWKTSDEIYFSDIKKAAGIIKSSLFRPPYGRITQSQAKKLSDVLNEPDIKIIMWDVLSADFDKAFSNEQCFSNIIEHVTAGSIVVFHDSEKAFSHLKFILPRTLEYLSKSGYQFKRIE